MRRIPLLLLLLVLAVAGGLLYWFKPWGRTAAEPRVVSSEVLKRGTVSEVLEATGIVKTQVGAIVKIGIQATGRIERMSAKVGDPVHKGEVIAVIDDRELRAQEKRALGDVEAAKVALQFAARNLRRQEPLLAQRIIDQGTFDQAAEKAQNTQRLLEARQGDLEAIRMRLSYTRVVSPISGVVGQVAAQEGETVVAGLQAVNLVTVIDPSRLEMWIYMDETDVGRVAPGQRVEFRVDAFPEDVFVSAVKQIYPQPEIRDNIVYYQVLVRVTEEQAKKLRPEMTTHVRVFVRAKDDVLALPNAAVKWVDGEQVVYVLSASDKAANATAAGRGKVPLRKAKPELGLRGLTHSEVLSGLSEGDIVATQLVPPSAGTGAAPAAPAAPAPPASKDEKRK